MAVRDEDEWVVRVWISICTAAVLISAMWCYYFIAVMRMPKPPSVIYDGKGGWKIYRPDDDEDAMHWIRRRWDRN